MKPLILLGLVAFVRGQYSGETQDLSNSQLDALKDIFGDAAAGGAYSGQQVGRLEGGTSVYIDGGWGCTFWGGNGG